jgi:hypothetical protein
MKSFFWKSSQESQDLKNHPGNYEDIMNIYEDEELGRKFEEISDLMGDFILDVIRMSLKKINNENLIFRELNEVRLEAAKEDIHIKNSEHF